MINDQKLDASPPTVHELVSHAAQVKYLTTFAEKVGREQCDAESATVIKGRAISQRVPRHSSPPKRAQARAGVYRECKGPPFVARHCAVLAFSLLAGVVLREALHGKPRCRSSMSS